MTKFYFPPIGMRIIKSAVAVFFTLILTELRPHGIPIYAAIAAIICIQNSSSDSLMSGINRIIGTFTGACFGLLTLLLIRHVSVLSTGPLHTLLISVIIIFILYVTILLKQPASSSLTCVIFLGIVFSSDEQLPQFAAINRLIDTLVGIIISYLINGIWSFRKRNLKTLFVMAFDGVLAGEAGVLSNYAKINLNRLFEKKAAITVTSYRAPAVLLPQLSAVQFRLPLIVMNGAAAYDVKERSIPYYVSIPRGLAHAVIDVGAAPDVTCYKYAMLHDELHVYYDDVCYPAEEGLQRGLISRIYQSSVRGDPPEDAEMLYLFYVGEDSPISRIEEKIRGLPESGMLNIIRDTEMYYPGFSNLEITSASASILGAVRWLMERDGYRSLVAFGRGEADVPLLTAADRGFSMKGAVPGVQALGLPCAGSHIHDDAIRKIHRLFYRRGLEKSASHKGKE
jgi:hydroxymethylpyrimidine pyrophosphatase-like HAD family hydrolase